MSRFLDPAVLGAISGLDLVARTVVDGFVAGLHRSADFGFSQEFAEYRAYTPGDDLRHVDWNVFARAERMYLKRYRGETNSLITVLLDASNSMNYTSHSVTKMNYARFMCAAILHLAIRTQRDAAGLLVFDGQVREYIKPSTRHGQLPRLFAALEAAEPRAHTSFDAPMEHLQTYLRRRGIVVVVSDFYAPPADVIRAIEPLRFHGNEILLFHVMDPREIRPDLGNASVLVDLETGDRMEVSNAYAANEYREKIDAHIAALRAGAERAGLTYELLVTDRPLDSALREYLTIRQHRK